MTVSDLTRFLLSRLDEDERDAHLFHEFTCAAQGQQARVGWPGSWCRCPVPAQTLVRVQVIRSIIADCERQIREPDSGAPGMLPAVDRIPKILGALTLSYQLHPQWNWQWHP